MDRQQFGKFVLFGTLCFGSAITGMMLASDQLMLAVAMAGLIWFALLPYHATLAVFLATATFGSALIVPFVPGRPTVWETAAVLGWTGLMLTLALRRHDPAAWAGLLRNRMLVFGAAGYCVTLLVIMHYRGVGLKLFGGGQIGGRVYFQQLLCVVFPLLFAARPLNERTLLRLFVVQCLLSGTFLFADFVLAYGGPNLRYLLYFFELPADGINFELQSLSFGIRRFQSLFFISMGIICLIWVARPFRDYANRAAVWLWPLTLVVFALGLFGGHRYLIFNVAVTGLVVAWAQRFFRAQQMVAFGALAGSLLLAVYLVADQLPLAAQRALSILPGIQVSRVAKDDGQGTWELRQTLRRVGFEIAHEYYWLGRGFGNIKVDDYSSHWDPSGITAHIESGRFYNGLVGLLVNTGIPGTVFMLMFMGGATSIAMRILRHVRTYGAEDPFARMSSVLAGLWMAGAVSFIFLHGDAEYALRTFSLQVALLYACDWHLRQRVKAMELEESAPEPAEGPEPLLPLPEPALARRGLAGA